MRGITNLKCGALAIPSADTNFVLVSAVVAVGGAGYVVGEILTVSGGTVTKSATVRVATLAADAVATVTVIEPGEYSVVPASPAATTTNLVGAGCTLTLTTANAGAVGTLTLTANAATSVISNASITASSLVYIMPTSANAAADQGSATGVYISARSSGVSFTLTHPNNANADKTFNYLIVN